MLNRSLTGAENIKIDEIMDSIGCNNPHIRNDYKDRYATLETGEERSLILELTKRFTYIPLSSYPLHLKMALDSFTTSLESDTPIVVMNGLGKRDYGKVKSNYLISYQFKGLNLGKSIAWSSKTPRVLDDMKSLLGCKDTGHLELVLVDDFIGSGETIESSYNFIFHRLAAHNKKMPHVSVVCIVVMQQAVDLMSRMGIRIFSSKTVDRGISDHYIGEDLTNAKKLMTKIENRIKVKDQYRFGYRQSEALVCMERCPNNTFPYFWFNVKYGKPPFKR